MYRVIIILAAFTFTVISSAAVAGAEGEPVNAPRHAVIVLTNHGELGHTGEPTGCYLPEAAHPWKVLTEAGFSVTFASPRGGAAPIDPASMDRTDEMNAAFLDDPEVRKALDHTLRLAEIKVEAVDALVFAGGHGTMWDLPSNKVVGDAIVGVHEAGGVVAAVCHGPACFVGVVDGSGRPFVKGRKLAAFTNAEERAVQKDAIVPFMLETRLRELGADVVTAPNFQEQVVVDGRLVTGQNPASAEKMGHEIVRLVTDE